MKYFLKGQLGGGKSALGKFKPENVKEVGVFQTGKKFELEKRINKGRLRLTRTDKGGGRRVGGRRTHSLPDKAPDIKGGGLRREAVYQIDLRAKRQAMRCVFFKVARRQVGGKQPEWGRVSTVEDVMPVSQGEYLHPVPGWVRGDEKENVTAI